MNGLRAGGRAPAAHVRVVFGGIIPIGDFAKLQSMGVAKVFTPSDYDLLDIMEEITALLEPET